MLDSVQDLEQTITMKNSIFLNELHKKQKTVKI